MIVDQNHRGGGSQKLQGARAGFGIELLATGPQQIPLQQAVGEQHEDHLMDDQVESTRREGF